MPKLCIAINAHLAEQGFKVSAGTIVEATIISCGRVYDPASTERLRRLARSMLRRCAPEGIVAENPT